MVIKNNRISKKKDFDYIFKKGKNISGVLLILKFIKNNLGNNRFAFIINKKVSSKAIVRNKIRRRISETVKIFKNNENGLDIVFIALPAIRDKNFIEIKEEVNTLLSKIGF
jgi:ribonuclease P protein component